MCDTDLIPLAQLVLEGIADSIDRLADDLGHEVLVDDIGRRAVTPETARRLFAERAEEQERTRAMWAKQQAELQRQHEESFAGILAGVPVPEGLQGQGLSALEVMRAGDFDQRLDNAGHRYEEFTSGGLTYHSLHPEEDG